jgi:hypothetical protein
MRTGFLMLAAVWAGVPALADARPAFRSETPQPLNRFSAEQIRLLEKLNRADRRHLPRLPSIVVPHRWDLPELAYSPMPHYSPWAAPHSKALMVDLPGQVFAAYEYGHQVRWGPISSGRQGHLTPSGEFHLNWRSRSRRSSLNQSWLMEWYFNFHNTRGIAFHKYALPGQPASHACIRLLERDARWLYGWGDGWTVGANRQLIRPGAPVRIVGSYDFASPRPWLRPEWWEQRIPPLEGPVVSESRAVAQPTNADF